MSEHIQVGIRGEELAVAWLKEKGYTIICRNWRFSHYEIDIVAHKGKKLHFVEVKTRKSNRFGYPEESVTKGKFKHLKKAADAYLYQNPGNPWIQYDILSITMNSGKVEYFLLEDVFL